MKKTLVFFIILLSILCFPIVAVQAAGETMTIEPSTNAVNPGETFTVNVHAESTDGINMLAVNYNYDKEKLKLLDYSIPDAYTDWSGKDADELVIIITNGEIVTSVDCVLTFEVQQNVPDNTETTIKFEQAGIDTFANSDHRFDFDDTQLNIQIGDMAQSQTLSIILIIVIAIVAVVVIVGIIVIIRKKMKLKK